MTFAIHRSIFYGCTWPIGSDACGVGLGSEGCAGLELGVGELGQVGHHRQFIHLRVAHLLGFDQLEQTKEASQCLGAWWNWLE